MLYKRLQLCNISYAAHIGFFASFSTYVPVSQSNTCTVFLICLQLTFGIPPDSWLVALMRNPINTLPGLLYALSIIKLDSVDHVI